GPKRCHFEIISSEALSSEMLSAVAAKNAETICIGAMPPDAIAPPRYLCTRLRERFPEARILVGRWGFTGDCKGDEAQLSSAGATHIANSLRETRAQLLQVLLTDSGRAADSTADL